MRPNLFLDPSPPIIDSFGELVVVSMLFWFVLHMLYERGLLGPWPPPRRTTRVGVVLFLLYPWVVLGGLSLAGTISRLLPSMEFLAFSILYMMHMVEELFLVLILSLIYFRILRSLWRKYGAAGATIVLTVPLSISIILTSFGLSQGIIYFIFDTGVYAYRFYGFMFLCSNHNLLRPKVKTEPVYIEIPEPKITETVMSYVYRVIISLVRRVVVDRDPSDLEVLKFVLGPNSGMEKPVTLACKVLGIDQVALLQTVDIENAMSVLNGVDTRWGNFSRFELCVLIVLTVGPLASILMSIWLSVNMAPFGEAPGNVLVWLIRNPLLGTVFFGSIFLLVLALLSSSSLYVRKPGKDYNLANPHTEALWFTMHEFNRRRVLDVLVVVTALCGTTYVTWATLVLSGFPDGTRVLIYLSIIFVLIMVLLAGDPFVRGKRPTLEQMIQSIRMRSLEIASKT